MNTSPETYQTGTNWSNVRKYLPILFKQLSFGERVGLFIYYLSAACQRFSGIPFCKSRVFHYPGLKVYADSQGCSAMAMMFLAELLNDDPYKDLDTSHFTADSLLLDIGANAGFFTLLRCIQNPNLHVVCVEPHPGSFDLLKRNIELNDLTDRVSIHNCAIADTEGSIMMIARKHSSMLSPSQPGNSKNEVSVPTKSLNSLAAELSCKCSAAKIDVEGHEAQVLNGGDKALGDMTAIILEVHGETLKKECSKILEGAGYSCTLNHAILFGQRQA